MSLEITQGSLAAMLPITWSYKMNKTLHEVLMQTAKAQVESVLATDGDSWEDIDFKGASLSVNTYAVQGRVMAQAYLNYKNAEGYLDTDTSCFIDLGIIQERRSEPQGR